MKKLAKFLNVVSCVSVSALLLVGCGSSSDGGSGAKGDGKDDVLTVAMELAYPPFETKDNDGNPMGISVDIANAFGEYLGQEVVIENISWDGLIPSLQTNKADMVISSMTITEPRAEQVLFTDPYANSLLAILTNKDSDVASIEDLNQAGKTVAVKTGSTGFFYAQEHLSNAEIISLADESACVMEVSQGKADGFLYDQLTIYRNWQNNLNTTSAVFIPFQESEKWGVAMNLDNQELADAFNEFLVGFRAEAGFVKLADTHLKEEKVAFEELGFQWFFDLTE